MILSKAATTAHSRILHLAGKIFLYIGTLTESMQLRPSYHKNIVSNIAILQFFSFIFPEVLACLHTKFLSTLLIQKVVSHFFSGYTNFIIPCMMSEVFHPSLKADHFLESISLAQTTEKYPF